MRSAVTNAGLCTKRSIGVRLEWRNRGVYPGPPAMSYYASKQAVIMFTKGIAALAWSGYGVRANVVSPGPVETSILADFEATMGGEVLEAA